MTKQKKNIVFDLDGVLINSLDNMEYAWQKVCLSHSLEIPFRDYKKYIGIPFFDILEKLNINKLLFNDIKREYNDYSLNNLSLIKLYDNIEIFLESIFHHHKIHIATSKSYSRTIRILNHFNIKKYFINIVTPEILGEGKGKPDPESLFYISKKENVSSKDLIYIGDTIYDWKCAKSANSEFIFANWGYGKKIKDFDNVADKIHDIHNFM